MQNIKKIVVALGLVTLCACASVKVGAPSGITYINSDHMVKLIAADTPLSSYTETGTMGTSVVIKNLSNKRVMIEGRATFTGENGALIESPTGWYSTFIEGGSNGSLQFLSISNAAKQVNIELREGSK